MKTTMLGRLSFGRAKAGPHPKKEAATMVVKNLLVMSEVRYDSGNPPMFPGWFFDAKQENQAKST